jgi:hypothetical protein
MVLATALAELAQSLWTDDDRTDLYSCNHTTLRCIILYALTQQMAIISGTAAHLLSREVLVQTTGSDAHRHTWLRASSADTEWNACI